MRMEEYHIKIVRRKKQQKMRGERKEESRLKSRLLQRNMKGVEGYH